MRESEMRRENWSDIALGGSPFLPLVRHPSGAAVLVDRGHHATGAAIHLATPARDDTGLGHLLEHLVFRGEAGGKAGDLYADMMFSGPVRDLNASTLSGHTTYHLTSATAGGRDRGVLRLLRAILEFRLAPEHLVEERAIVASEMAGHWADPQAATLDGLRALALPGERAAQAGLPDLVTQSTAQQILDFHRRNYHPSALLLYLTGAAPDGAFWSALDALLSAAPEPLPPALPPVAPLALPMSLPPKAGVPALAWVLPGLGPRAVKVLRGAVETLAPDARCRAGVETGVADLRLAGPILDAEAAEAWLKPLVAAVAKEAFATALQAQARLDLLRGPTLTDRQSSVVQAWRSGADPVAALSADETPLLQAWVAEETDRRRLVERLQQPMVAHVFRSGHLLPKVAPAPRPMPLPSPRRVRSHKGKVPSFLALSLVDLPTQDLPTAGALLRRFAARQGVLLAPIPSGAWIGLGFPPGVGDRLPADPPPLAPPLPLALHLRIERQLWAALTPDGAWLAALEEDAEPAAADRIWRTLGARRLLPDVEPQAGPARALRPVLQPDQPIAGRLSTLGMGVALGDDPLLPLIAHALEWQWLRQSIRREGGAYGVRCRVGPGGTLVFLSARDPAPPEATLARFAQSADWLRRTLRGEDLAAAIRGTLEKLAPMPSSAWEEHLALWQARLDPPRAPQRLAAAVAKATSRQVADLADRLEEALPRAARLVFRGLG